MGSVVDDELCWLRHGLVENEQAKISRDRRTIGEREGTSDFEIFQTRIVQHGGRKRLNLGEEGFGVNGREIRLRKIKRGIV